MAKRFQICELCSSYKLVNYAGLCKRCNKSEKATAILEEAAAERDAHHAADMEAAAEAAEAAEEASEAGEESEESEDKSKEPKKSED